MKLIRIVVAAVLFLGVATFAYSQEPGAEPKPPKQEEPPRDVAPSRQEDPKAPKPEKQEEPKPQKPEKQENPKMPNDSSKPAHAEKGQQGEQGHARLAGKSAHIPDPKFKASFGRQHRFAVKQVITTTTVVPGQTQFVYSGYTFIILDPWPSVWLFSDDCYIDYVNDDYFLFDAFHPGFRIALFVQG